MSTIKLRRDTAANWLAADPVLSIAEPGLETDTSYVKYGDGATPWTSLPYASSVASALVNGGPSVTVDAGGNLTVPSNVISSGTVYANQFNTNGLVIIPNDGSAGGIQSQNNLGQIYFNDDNSLLFIITGTYQVSFNADGTVQFPGYVFPEGTGSTGQVLVAGSNPLYLEWQDQTSTSSSLGDFTFSNSTMHIPVIGGGSTSYLNAGGVGTRNSVQIRTEINYVDTDINTSEIAIEAGNGGFSAQVYGHWTGGADGSGGPTLVYAGVENLSGSNGPGFAGFLANDPSVTSEYTVKIDGGGNICVSPFNPYTSDTYSAALGALASFDGGSGVGQFNGIFADPAKTYLKGSNGVNVTTVGGQWTFGADGSLTAPGAIYGGSNSIGLVTPAPLNLNNTGPIGQSKTQLNLINTAGNGGTGSAIDYYTYVDQGNGLPGARLSAVDDDNYSANFSIALKGRGNAGNNGLTTVWQFGSDGSLTLPAGGTVSYTPATASDWTGTPPTTIQEALDRLAAAFKTANGTGA